jgi:hypothetical protein
MMTALIALVATFGAIGVLKILDSVTFRLFSGNVKDEELSPAQADLVKKQQALAGLELDLAVAEELGGFDPVTLNAMSERVDLAKDDVANAQIALTAEEAQQEAAAESVAGCDLQPILRAPALNPAHLAVRITSSSNAKQ